MRKTLVVLAAGIGSRFGGGIKQLTPVDAYGHLIIDYSIHDAIEAGFNRIVFIIRHNIEADFREVIGNRIEALCDHLGIEISYAFQEIDKFVEQVPSGRTKPWGTGHAVLCAAETILSSFAVINADDYYGKKAFQEASRFLETGQDYALIAYQLKNTLSDHGGVTRGICTVEQGKLVGIDETKGIVKTVSGAEANGKPLNVNSLVSMNFWCYPFTFLDVLKKQFPVFISKMRDPLRDEFLLPNIADQMLKEGESFIVLPTDDHWFGITYKEDRPLVEKNFECLIDNKVYFRDLFSDLNPCSLF